jgi:hypothetical protein
MVVRQEEARANRRTADEQPEGQPLAKRRQKVSVTASFPERAGKRFAVLQCLWATEGEIFDGEEEEVEPEAFSTKDTVRREKWVKKGVYDFRASTPSTWLEGWGTESYRSEVSTLPGALISSDSSI